MSERKVIVNGRALTRSEIQTLCMALEITLVDLKSTSLDHSIEGTRVAEHLDNATAILKLVCEN